MFWVGCYKRNAFKAALELATRYGLSAIIEKDGDDIIRIYDVNLGKWIETEQEQIALSDKLGRL